MRFRAERWAVSRKSGGRPLADGAPISLLGLGSRPSIYDRIVIRWKLKGGRCVTHGLIAPPFYRAGRGVSRGKYRIRTPGAAGPSGITIPVLGGKVEIANKHIDELQLEKNARCGIEPSFPGMRHCKSWPTQGRRPDH